MNNILFGIKFKKCNNQRGQDVAPIFLINNSIKMNTEIQNLEQKIDALVMRMNNAEDVLNENATKEINLLRTDLQKLIDEFDLMKSKMQSNNSEQKISREDIEKLADLIVSYGVDGTTNEFSGETFTDIDDCKFSINYDSIVDLDYATINVHSYFCDNVDFTIEGLTDYIKVSGQNNEYLLKYISKELFDLVYDIFDDSVRDINTTITFNRIDDFECDFQSYDKRLELTEVTINADDLIESFTEDIEFEVDAIMGAIASLHNVNLEADDEDDSEDDSEENNSEE